jgi:hypothetical protein
VTTYTYPAIIPNESTIEFESNTQVFRSPLNGAIQTVDRSGERLTMSLVHRNLSGADRAVLMAFAVKLNGQQHRVTLYNHAENQRGAFGGTPLVAGASQTGLSLNIDGCSSGITNWIRAGDWFSVNGELKLCTADANSDGGGLCTIAFTPRLRASPANNDPLTTTNGTGTFFLAKNSNSWTNRPGGFSDFSLSFVEDIAA